MKEITEQLFAGADKPIQEAEKKLPEKVGKIANNVLAEASRMTESESYLAQRASGLGLRSMAVPIAGNGQQTSTAAAESRSSLKGSETNPLIMIKADNINIREESDIHKVANEFYKLYQQRQRGLGKLDI